MQHTYTSLLIVLNIVGEKLKFRLYVYIYFSKEFRMTKKKPKDDTEVKPSIMRGKFEMAVGTKVEALDYIGNW